MANLWATCVQSPFLGDTAICKISQIIDLFYNFPILVPVLAAVKCLLFIVRKEDVRV
jgi:hypothetical protein